MRPDFIETFSGRSFRPLDPSYQDIDIGDVAHALSHQCRFSGHTIVHYSVAEHSVRVSNLLQSWGANSSIVRWGLLHDATEAYLVDIPSPLKSTQAFAAYREAEAQLQLAVCRRFRMDPVQPREVTTADAVLLATEARDLMAYMPSHWVGLTEAPLPERIIPWSSFRAKQEFLRRFEDLQ